MNKQTITTAACRLISRQSRPIEALYTEEIRIEVPLNWSATTKQPETIEVFARLIRQQGGENRPYLVYLQGGPGFEAPRTCTTVSGGAWIDLALQRYQMIMLDQRGTGLSTPLGNRDLAMGTAKLCERLQNFRADSIVKDCEALRQLLGIEKFNLLGQSFGGFTTLNYLCNYPDSLDKVFFTGGISSIGLPCEKVYETTFAKMIAASNFYYERFPEDKTKMQHLAAMAEKGEIVLPGGEVLSLSRLRSLGMLLGNDNGWFNLHSLLEHDPTSNVFLYDLEHTLSFSARNPIYLVLHEACYADGVVTNFAAERVMPQAYLEDKTLFTGEHIFSEWFDTVPSLRPWKDIALALAKVKWPRLYSEDSLQNSQAQGAAAVYYHDRYVPLEFSTATAALMPGVKLLITSEHEHSGLRTSGTRILASLFDLADGKRPR